MVHSNNEDEISEALQEAKEALAEMQDFKNKLLEPKVMESGFMIKANKGEVRKTFHEFLTFYKSNIFKDINMLNKALLYASKAVKL